MSENRTDEPSTPQEPVVHPTKPLWWFVYAHYLLVVLVTPLFLFTVFRVLTFRGGVWVPAPGLPEALVIAGFIGLFMRKERAYLFWVIISVIAEVLLIRPIVSGYSFSGYWGIVFVIWFVLILMSASVCGLTCPAPTGGKPPR